MIIRILYKPEFSGLACGFIQQVESACLRDAHRTNSAAPVVICACAQLQRGGWRCICCLFSWPANVQLHLVSFCFFSPIKDTGETRAPLFFIILKVLSWQFVAKGTELIDVSWREVDHLLALAVSECASRLARIPLAQANCFNGIIWRHIDLHAIVVCRFSLWTSFFPGKKIAVSA